MSAQSISLQVGQSPGGLDGPPVTRKCLKTTQSPGFASCYHQSAHSLVRGHGHLWADHTPTARWWLPPWSVAGVGVQRLGAGCSPASSFPRRGHSGGRNGNKFLEGSRTLGLRLWNYVLVAFPGLENDIEVPQLGSVGRPHNS